MQKIGQLQAYVEVSETEGAYFAHPTGNEDQARLIKMRILSETQVNLYVDPVDADPDSGEIEPIRFLAHLAPGMEQLEFYYRGSFALRLVGGNVWLDTYDNTAFNIESLSPESFARLWEREERDPRILEIEQAARHNQMILRHQMAEDRAAFLAEMAQIRAEANKHVDPAASNVVTPAASVPAQSPGVPSASNIVDAGTPPGGDGGNA